MGWKEIIHNNVDRLELFEIFKDIDAVFYEEFEEIRTYAICGTLLVFLAFIYWHSLDIHLVSCDDAK